MSRAQISKQYALLSQKWPVDKLRPEVAFQNVLKKRIDAPPSIPQPNEANTAQVELPSATQSQRQTQASELREIKALNSLLENKYAKKYPLSPKMMNPASSPNHYENLAKELDEAPTRSLFQSWMRKLSNMVRWQ